MLERTWTRASGRLLRNVTRRSTWLPSITTATVAGMAKPPGTDAAMRLHLPFDPVARAPAGTTAANCATGNGAGDPAVAMMAMAPIVAKFTRGPKAKPRSAAKRGRARI